MPLFRSKKDRDKDKVNVLTTQASNPSKLKLMFRSESSVNVNSASPAPDAKSKKTTGSVTGDKMINGRPRTAMDDKLANDRLKRRISTVVDDDKDNDQENEFDDTDDSDSDYDDDDDDDDDTDDSDEDTDDTEYDPKYNEYGRHDNYSDDEIGHSHLVQIRPPSTINGNLVSQLSSLMGYCSLGLVGNVKEDKRKFSQLVNEELERTFSLIDDSCKIHRLSSSLKKTDPHLNDSVIGEDQLEAINLLTKKLNDLQSLKGNIGKQYDYLSASKSLYERYGVVKDIIGRGAYGVIKIIDPNANLEMDEKLSECTKLDVKQKLQINLFKSGKNLYAVKELLRRNPGDSKQKESNDKFIERVISEFIISSTLNNKHIVKTVDFMVTLPPRQDSKYLDPTSSDLLKDGIKANQVMQCTSAGDMFTYLKNLTTLDSTGQNYVISLSEIDCFIKQIAKGLWYMHQHGVAHCDLKLENILINFDFKNYDCDRKKNLSKINLKLSDFGKSNVFRTKWDVKEQFVPYSSGPIGSTPYIAPEEFSNKWCGIVSKKYKKGYSLVKKDCWALGIIILVLFNIRKNFFCENKALVEEGSDEDAGEESTEDDGDASTIFNKYNCTYLWESTDVKAHHFTSSKDIKYRDKVFGEYVKDRLISDYDNKSKEWLIKKRGNFKPIDNLFHLTNDEMEDEEITELCELRKLFIYKLLDINPETRLDTDDFIKGDWMHSIDCCS